MKKIMMIAAMMVATDYEKNYDDRCYDGSNCFSKSSV